MRSWVPVPGTTKGTLVEVALTMFGSRGYAAVGVTELASGAGVTIGALYHHFGSKAGLYAVVRADVERRVLDRMEGAAAVRPGDPAALLLVGFDYLVRTGYARLLAEPAPDTSGTGVVDPVEAYLGSVADRDGMPLGRLLAATFRAALEAAAEAAAAGRDTAGVRAALAALVRPAPFTE